MVYTRRGLHLLVILGIALLVFGSRKIPELCKALGEAIRGFRAAMKEGEALPEPKVAACLESSTKAWPSLLRRTFHQKGGLPVRHRRRSILWCTAPLGIWGVCHFEHQRSPIGDVRVLKPRLGERLAVQLGRLDVLVLG